MKILSYNVNGIRSAISKGFIEWLQYTNSDLVCLQEIKATTDQIPLGLFEKIGYYSYWHPAQKKGYSGVAILSKTLPKHVEFGCGIEKYDLEGRVIRADFDHFSLMSVYMPSGSSGDLRQSFKMQWLDDFHEYIANLRLTFPNLIISGDYNICHQAIDIHNPKSNAQSSGFLPAERAWLSQFIQNGFIDTFRLFNQEPHHYTWWSFRAGARNKNLGWRIDYHLATDALKKCLNRSIILPEAKHSDHCPILLELDLTSPQ
jgi:exodeoxyribonuclease-3